MTRLLQVMGGATLGGAEAFFERLAASLAAGPGAIEQRLVVRDREGRAERLRAAGLDVATLPFGGWLDWRTRPALRGILRAYRPDLVLSWMSRATRACPKGDFVHIARLGGYYDLKYYRHCDYLIGNTVDIVDYLTRAGWPASRAAYLPNFVAAEPAEPWPRAAERTPEDVPLLLALGRLHRNKAFDVLLQALARVPDAVLWLAGEGPERAALTGLAGALGVAERVRFLGWRQDVASLYAAADVVVVPSRHEPLGNVVLEGWARHRPVIAAASAGPAALIEDGISGRLVRVDDAAALAAALAEVIGEPAAAARLASGGHAAWQAGYTESAVRDRYLGFFRQVTH